MRMLDVVNSVRVARGTASRANYISVIVRVRLIRHDSCRELRNGRHDARLVRCTTSHLAQRALVQVDACLGCRELAGGGQVLGEFMMYTARISSQSLILAAILNGAEASGLRRCTSDREHLDVVMR